MFTPRTMSLCAALALAPAAHAALIPLAPGDGVALTGTNAASCPELEGSLLASLSFPVEIATADNGGQTILFQGSFTSQVLQSDDTGELHFISFLQSTNDTLNGIVADYQLTAYNGWSTDVNYRADTTGTEAPSRATRSADADDVAALFGNGFAPGNASRPFTIATDAPDFARVGAVVITLTSGEDIKILGVYAPVPTPGSLSLLALAGLIATRRRRR